MPYQLQVPIGTVSTVQDPAQYINVAYQYIIGVSGILALLILVYSGVQYMLAVGSPAKQTEARSRITQTIFGLFLLFSVVLIINFLDPNLTNLTLFQQKTGTPESRIIYSAAKFSTALDQLVATAKKGSEYSDQSIRSYRLNHLTETKDKNDVEVAALMKAEKIPPTIVAEFRNLYRESFNSSLSPEEFAKAFKEFSTNPNVNIKAVYDGLTAPEKVNFVLGAAKDNIDAVRKLNLNEADKKELINTIQSLEFETIPQNWYDRLKRFYGLLEDDQGKRDALTQKLNSVLGVDDRISPLGNTNVDAASIGKNLALESDTKEKLVRAYEDMNNFAESRRVIEQSNYIRTLTPIQREQLLFGVSSENRVRILHQYAAAEANIEAFPAFIHDDNLLYQTIKDLSVVSPNPISFNIQERLLNGMSESRRNDVLQKARAERIRLTPKYQ